jgi:hypothetical protein
MKKYGRWMIGGVVVLILGIVIARNSIESPMLPRVSETWSRGRIVGQMSVKRPVALRPAPDGGMLLAWPNVNGKIELAHLGVDGELLLNRVLPIVTRQARDPQLQVGADGRLRLLWREQTGQNAGIYYALLQADGTPVGQSQLISEPGSRIADPPVLIQGKDGRLHALWSDDAGVRWAALNDAGETTAGPVLLIPEGGSLMARVDDEGRPHLIWQHRVRGREITINYAVLDLERGELSAPVEMTRVQISGPLQLETMALGLSQDMGYVFWSVYNAKFETFTFQYASFPLDEPQRMQVIPWPLYTVEGIRAIAPLDGTQSSLPVVLSKRMPGEEQLDLRATLAIVGGGRSVTDEQILTSPSQAAMKPVLVADEQSNLHLAWLTAGGAEGFRVVYTTNAPEIVRNYNAFTFIDVVDAMLDGVFRLSTVVVSLIVSLLAWAVVPVVGLAIYHLVTSEETLSTRRAQVAVIVSLAIVVALSLVVPPRIGVDVSWPVLSWIVPAFSALVTAALTVSIVRRRDEMHLFGAFFIFTITYSLLQTTLFLMF